MSSVAVSTIRLVNNMAKDAEFFFFYVTLEGRRNKGCCCCCKYCAASTPASSASGWSTSTRTQLKEQLQQEPSCLAVGGGERSRTELRTQRFKVRLTSLRKFNVIIILIILRRDERRPETLTAITQA